MANFWDQDEAVAVAEPPAAAAAPWEADEVVSNAAAPWEADEVVGKLDPWDQDEVVSGAEQSQLASVGNAFVAGLGDIVPAVVGGTAKLMDAGADVVSKWTGLPKGGAFANVAEFTDEISAENARLRPVSDQNRIAGAIGGGAAQGLALLSGGAVAKGLGMANAATVPLAAGFAMGGGEGIDRARAMGVNEPEAQLAMGALFGSAEVVTERLGGIGNKQATEALMNAYRQPAAELLKRAAKTVAGEGGEEVLAGSAQDLIAWAFANEDPDNPGFTTTGVKLPALDAEFVEDRGLDFVGGAAGGAVFAGANALMNRDRPMRPSDPGGTIEDSSGQVQDSRPEAQAAGTTTTVDGTAWQYDQGQVTAEALATAAPETLAALEQAGVISRFKVQDSSVQVQEANARIEGDLGNVGARFAPPEMTGMDLPALPPDPAGNKDILNWLNVNPIMAPRKGKERGGEYNWRIEWEIPPTYRRSIMREGTPNIDNLAKALYGLGTIKDDSPQALIDEVRSAIAKRETLRKSQKAEQEQQKQAEASSRRYEQAQLRLSRRRESQEVDLDALAPGDVFRMDGQEVTVADVVWDEDGRTTQARLRGDAFGEVLIRPGARVWADKGAPVPAAPTPETRRIEQVLEGNDIQEINSQLAMTWADRVLAENQGRVAMGFDPMLGAAYAVKGAQLVREGMTTFARWSAEMVRRFGEGVRQYLQGAWNAARRTSEVGAVGDLAPGMIPKARTSVAQEALKPMRGSPPVLSREDGSGVGNGWDAAAGMSQNASSALGRGMLMEPDFKQWLAERLQVPVKAFTRRTLQAGNVSAQNIFREYHHVGRKREIVEFYNPAEVELSPKFFLGLAREFKSPTHQKRARRAALEAWQKLRENLMAENQLGLWTFAGQASSGRGVMERISPSFKARVKTGELTVQEAVYEDVNRRMEAAESKINHLTQQEQALVERLEREIREGTAKASAPQKLENARTRMAAIRSKVEAELTDELKDHPSNEMPPPANRRGRESSAKLGGAAAPTRAEGVRVTDRATEATSDSGDSGQSSGGFVNTDVVSLRADGSTVVFGELVDLAGRAVQAGLDFARWSAEMVRRFGEGVRQYLQGAWNAARRGSERGSLDIGGNVRSMASDSGAAQNNEPSPGGLSEAEVLMKHGARIGGIVNDLASVLRDGDSLTTEGDAYGFEIVTDEVKDGELYISWIENKTAPKRTVADVLMGLSDLFDLRLTPLGGSQESYYESLGFVKRGKDMVLARTPQAANPEFSRAEGGAGFSNTQVVAKRNDGSTVVFGELVNLAGRAVQAGVDFARWSAQMIRQFGAGVRQYLQGAWNAARRTSETGAVDVGPGGQWQSQFGERVQADERLTPELRAAPVSEFDIQRQQDTHDQAKAVIQQQGLAGALAAFRDDQSLPIPLRIAGLMQVAQNYDALSAAARATNDPAKLAEADNALEAAVEAKVTLETIGNEAGRNLAMFNTWARLSPDGMLARFERRLAKEHAINPRVPATIPPADRARLRKLAADAMALPEGVLRTAAVADLMAEMSLIEGIKTSDLWWSIWYGNVLAGLGTQSINVAGSTENVLLSFVELGALQPGALPGYLRGLVRGMKQGTVEAWSVLKGGPVVKPGKWTPQGVNSLELMMRQGGPQTKFGNVRDGAKSVSQWAAYVSSLAGMNRFVGRLLGGMDVFFYYTVYEGISTVAIQRALRKAGLKPGTVEFRREVIRQIGGDPAQYQADAEQARDELKAAGRPVTKLEVMRRAWELTRQRREQGAAAEAQAWAERTVYLDQLRGSGLWVSGLIKQVQKFPVAGRAVVPFNQILSSLFSRGLDYTGLGLARGLLGYHLTDMIAPPKTGRVRMTPMERRQRAVAGVVGPTLALAVAAYASQFGDEDDEDIPFWLYDKGPPDRERRRQMPQGWQPYTIKVGGKYIRYAETPLGPTLAAVAGWLNAGRYTQEETLARRTNNERLALAMQAALQQYQDLGVLQGVADLMDLITGGVRPDKALERQGARGLSGLVPASGLLREIEALMDPTKIDADGVIEAMQRDIPVVSGWGTRPDLNALAEPLTEPGLPVVKRFVSKQVADENWSWIRRNGLRVPAVDSGQHLEIGRYLLPKEAQGATLQDIYAARGWALAAADNGLLTREQQYQFAKRTGELMKERIVAVRKSLQAGPTGGILPADAQMQVGNRMVPARDHLQTRVNAIFEASKKAAMAEVVRGATVK